jgi:signal transduction histidine kinase
VKLFGSQRRARRRVNLGTAAFGVLLLAMTGLTVVSVIVLRRMSEQRQRTADDAIREYAGLGARLFGDRAYFVFEGIRIRILASIVGTHPAPGASAPPLDTFVQSARNEMDAIGFAAGDTNRGFFRIDIPTGRYEGAGAAASTQIGARIRDLLRTRPAPRDSRMDPMGWLMVDLPEPMTVGLTTMIASDGTPIAHYGFVYTRRVGWKSVGDAVMRDLPLLPAAFVDRQYRYGLDPSRTDTLVAIRLYDSAGRILYDSRPPFPGRIFGEFPFNTGSGAFRTVETLHPALVTAIRTSLRSTRTAPFFKYEKDGVVHNVQLPLEALLPIVALMLAILAGFGLWREQRLTRARRDFVASVSHELRTPLAQIRMFTETLLLHRERDEEERTQWLSIIGREARRLGDLVENILLFSHIDADRSKLEKERTDLGELIEEIIEGYVPLAAQKRMSLVADAPSRIFCLVDPRAMRQIVVNLLDNALKYGPAGQTVHIELERTGAVARLVVRDEGPGVKPADRRRMWQPFVRLGDKGTTGGSGIGLSVVRNLVELHDGTIAIDDAPGGGARFTIELAVSDSAAGLPARATGEFSVKTNPDGHRAAPRPLPRES